MLKIKKNNLRDNSEELLDKITVLQNDINAFFGFETISVVNIGSEEKVIEFAILFAKAFEKNNSKTLIIDCNFYNPHLFEKYSVLEKDNIITCSEGIDVYSPSAQVYPSEFFRNKALDELIEKNKDKYKHFIIVSPNIKEHKDFLVTSETINCSLLVVEKNVSKKSDVFDAAHYMEDNNLKLATIVVLS
jgi:Mrp family chromosome partitioning ATPase